MNYIEKYRFKNFIEGNRKNAVTIIHKDYTNWTKNGEKVPMKHMAFENPKPL